MPKREATIIGGGLFGDEGKGGIVDHLTRRYNAHSVFRYNGGSQAAHNVITSEGLHHCFAQFGSGTLVPGTLTYLSQFMFVDPLRLVSEYEVLASKGVKDVLERLIISEKCPVITPFHKFAGQLRELARSTGRFGSCGMGVGEAMNDFIESPDKSLTIGDLARPGILQKKLKQLQVDKTIIAKKILESGSGDELQKCFDQINSQDLLERCLESYSVFSNFPITFDDGIVLKRILDRPGTIIFEGAQGALLDRNRGFKPFVAKSDCSFGNAERLLTSFSGKIIKLSVVRAYMTRHGNGPFVTEDSELTKKLPDAHNVTNEWQGKFRIGWFDLVMARYALEVLGKVDRLALTNLDRILSLPSIQVCTSYRTADGLKVSKLRPTAELTKLLQECRPVYRKLAGLDIRDYIDFFEKELGVKISIVSYGPTCKDKFEI